MLRPVAPDAISNQIKDGLKGNYSNGLFVRKPIVGASHMTKM